MKNTNYIYVRGVGQIKEVISLRAGAEEHYQDTLDGAIPSYPNGWVFYQKKAGQYRWTHCGEGFVNKEFRALLLLV